MFSYIKIAMLVIVIGGAGAAYAYHKVTVAEFTAQVAQLEANNKTLKENNTTLQSTIENNSQKIRELEEQKVKERLLIVDLNTKIQQLDDDRKKYMRIFDDHNLTRLARAKPGLIETRVNNATAKVFQEIENNSKEVQNADN